MRRVQGRLPATNIVLAEEQDAEDQKEDRDVTINVPEETDFADAAVNYIEATADIPYATAAKIGMNLMLSHELGQYRPQGMETCALCEEDDSVDDDKKRHTYTVGHLREHVASDFYTPYKQWIRRAHQNRDARMAADLDDRDFTCPNCMEAAGDSESFKAMKKSTLHIWRSNSKNIAGKNDWTTPENSAKRKFDSPFLCRDNRESSGPSLAKLLTRTPRTRIPVSLLELRLPIPGGITTTPPPGSPGWKPTSTKPPRGAFYVARPGTFRNMPGGGHLICDRLKNRHK
ncbi:hypothetical protein N0V92_000196 [Colletotrichum tropicale]|nr:hypothetical protein N0V92_000196 [Colletotrichum tropicale]